jgi:hypothetical protein
MVKSTFKAPFIALVRKPLRLLKKIAYPLRKLLNSPVCHKWHNNYPSKRQVNRHAPVIIRTQGRQETPEEANRRFKEIMDYYLVHDHFSNVG